MNVTIISGRLTREADYRYTDSGQSMARFTLAVDKGLSTAKKKEFEAQNKPTADFINCIAWGKQADFVRDYTFKGGQVMVQGSITTGSYKAKEGHTIYTTDVNCFRVEPIDWKQKEGGAVEDTGFEADFELDLDDGRIPF